MSHQHTCLFSEPTRTLTAAHTQLVVDLSAVERNVNSLRMRMPQQARLMAMLKAEGYGTNATAMARFLGGIGVDIFGLAYVDEAIRLRTEGITQPLFVTHAAPYEASLVVNYNLETAASDKIFIDALAAEASLHNKQINVHLHVNTGMNRFGCTPAEALALAKQIHSYPCLTLAGIMTHFPVADDPRHDAFTRSQIDSFEKVIDTIVAEGIPLPWRHAANSSATLRFDLPGFNMARVGLALYGLHVSKECKEASALECALTLTSRIIAINTCKVGETVSYGRTFTVKGKDRRIAVVPIGYHDGIHRRFSGKGHVIVRGQKASMVGRICMDFMMIDVTDIPDAACGDTVQIFGGEAMEVETFAACGGTIAHEMIACLGPRIERVFIKR